MVVALTMIVAPLKRVGGGALYSNTVALHELCNCVSNTIVYLLLVVSLHDCIAILQTQY